MKVAIMSVIAGSALALLATPAQAATDRYDSPLACQTYPEEGLTFCSSSSGQYNSVNSRGAWVYNGKGTLFYSASYTDGSYYSESFATKISSVTSRENNVYRTSVSYTSVFGGVTCIAEQRLVFTAGQVRVDDFTVACT
jgi:hypothetical protein